MLKGRRKSKSLFRSFILLCLAVMFIQPDTLFAQVISNNGAAISVTSGIVINAKDAENISGGILSNDGTFNLSRDYTNTGTTSGNGTYRIGRNWTNNTGVFGPGVSTVIFNGADNQSIIRTAGETFFNLSIENTGAPASKAVGLANNVTVTGTLSLQVGNVNALTFKLLLANQLASSLNYTSTTGSRILGKFERGIGFAGTYLFPLGTSVFYNPANLITNSISSPGTVLSEFLTLPPPGNAGLPLPDLSVDPHVEIDTAYVDGYWRLTAANGFSSGSYNINIDGTGFTDTIRDITRIIKRIVGGGWTIADGIHIDAVGSVVSRINYTGTISILGTEFAMGKANPLIEDHPNDTIVCEDTYPSFSVTARGAEPLTYIWYKEPGILITNGPHYSGARTNTLTILGAVLSDAGNYYCVVRDRYRNTTISNSANLIVNKIPKATATPPLQEHECSGVAFDNVVLGESYGVPGTTYFWSRTNPAGITTAVPLTGTGMNIGDALTGAFINITDAPLTVTFTITPVGPSPTYCVGIPIEAVITINPTPRVIPVLSQICYNTNTSITLVSPSTMTMQNVIRFDYNITATAPPAVVAGNRTGSINVGYGTVLSFPYTNESDTLQSVYYNVTPTVPALGCPVGVEEAFEVKVHPKTITFNYPGTNGDGILITTPLTCEGGSDASIRVITSKGAGNYYFDWIRTSLDQIHGYNIPEILNQKGGRWDVTVTDNIGCTNSSYEFVEGAYLDSYLRVIDTSGYGTTCPGSDDGEIWIRENNSSTGIAPFEYWIIRNSQDTSLTTMHNFLPRTDSIQKYYGLLPGNYKLYLRDANGCFNLNFPEVNIIEPDIVTVEFEKLTYLGGNNVSCKGYSDGSVWIKTISGGNGGYSYKWSTLNGTITGVDTLDRLDAITVGTYYLQTTDRKGCVKIDSVTLIEPAGMQLAGSELSLSPDGNTNISCNGGSDGFIKLNITGGSGIYTYVWTKSPYAAIIATTKDISGLTAGDYTCIVSDINGCILTPSPSFTLTEPAALAIASTTSIAPFGSFEINCNGGTGSIDITVSGGSVGSYIYTWSTADGSGLFAGQEDQLVLTTGTYHLVVTDANNCQTTKDITLTQPPPLGIILTPKHITCFPAGFANGEVNLTVSGGVAPYNYLWSNGAVTEDISGLAEGYYTVNVFDANGCNIIDSVRIYMPPPLEYNKDLSDFNGYNISCYGQKNGSIEIIPTSGVPPFIYNWSGPNGTATTKNISDLQAGQYNLVITDSNNCYAAETFNLTEPARLGMILSLSTSTAGGYNINCAGESTGFIGIEPINQVNTVEYLWSDGIFGKTRMNLSAGEYHVIIVDENSCSFSQVITLTEPDSMKLAFTLSQPFCPDLPDGSITLDATGGVSGADYFYNWSDNSTGRNLLNIPKGEYKVKVTDLNGCSIRDSVKVEPLNETCLKIPNAISPNDDLINDVWNIDKIDLYPTVEIMIFNRWGETVWRSESGYPRPWDGKSNGRDLPIDSYHYIIDLHNGTKPLVGNVTIVR